MRWQIAEARSKTNTMSIKELINIYKKDIGEIKKKITPHLRKEDYSKIYKEQITINNINKFISDLEKTKNNSVKEFINSLTNKEYNKLRASLSNAEARRVLLEKEIKND